MFIRRSSLNRNHYFGLGLLVGLLLSFYIPQDVWQLVQQDECPQLVAEHILIEKFGQDFEPHLNLINKPLLAKKPVENVIRPRYYSSELGIREKIFIGVITSQDKINTLATAINRTTAHLVNKIKFFINADNVKTNYKLKNIVGFTDTRENLRPFHVIKYIADNYLDDYDYFLIIPDTVYVDARKLKSLLFHMSITFDIYMGIPIDSVSNTNNIGINSRSNDMQNDRNYCDLNAGILLSSSVIRKMRSNLDWCVRNGITNVHSLNIGRCVTYSSNIPGCQETFQGVHQKAFELKSPLNIFKDLNKLAEDSGFLNSTTVFPLETMDDFIRLHAYFSKYHLEQIQQQSFKLEDKSYNIANGSISNNILEIRWPLGVPKYSSPETRHDIITWQLLNGTHLFLPNTNSIIENLNRIDSLDFEKVFELVLKFSAHKYPHLKFHDLHTAYRKFDITRGMDYQLHIKFQDSRRSHIEIKSFQVAKPLGRVEVVPSPYVTESIRIAILVPIFEHQIMDGIEFIQQYERICMKNQDNTFLLMIFIYNSVSSSKGRADSFKSLKSLALDLSTKFKTDGSRIAWVSIRLPPIISNSRLPEDIMLNSLYGRNEILSIAVADLALPKIGLDSLVLMASTSMNFKADFLNRVRMNTIQGFQIYSPIGFMMYACKFLHFCNECETCDVSQSTGYFDKWNYDIMSFYSRDYVQARKQIENTLPIIRTDNDIEQILNRADKSLNTLLDMFVASQLSVHVLRGVEPNLRYGRQIKNFLKTTSNVIPKCPVDNNTLIDNYLNENPKIDIHITKISSTCCDKCIHLASRKQIADAVIRFEDRSIIEK